MTRTQYRELCRRAVAQRLKIDPSQVRTGRLFGLRRPGLVPCRYAVDLWWQTENSICRYVHIGAVYWRTRALVGDREILILQQIKDKLAGHKALAFTSTGFTRAALRAADEGGVALFVIRPKTLPPLSGKRPGGTPATRRPYTIRMVRPGMPRLLTKDEANRHIDFPNLKAWVERARIQGRLESQPYRSQLKCLIPAMAPLLRRRRDWQMGAQRTWRRRGPKREPVRKGDRTPQSAA